jgi:flagellar biosynthesis protein FlhG
LASSKHDNAMRAKRRVRNSRTRTQENSSIAAPVKTLAPVRVLPPVKVIAITGGKGGVGKTNVATNLGVALAARGRNVMLLDADFSLASVDALLGLKPRYNVAHVLSGECNLEETIVLGPRGMQVVPAASGAREMTRLSNAEHAGLIRAFSDLDRDLDVLLIDTAAGLSDSVTTFSHAAHHVVVVVCDEPASINGACALVNVLATQHGVTRFHVVASQTRSAIEGLQLFDTVVSTCDRQLTVSFEYLGAVPHDEHVREAIRQQVPVVDAYPACEAANAFKKLAAKADQWSVPQGARGHLEFFIERLVQAGTALEGSLQ